MSSKSYHHFVYRDLPKRRISCPTCGGDSFSTLCETDRYLMGVVTTQCDGCGLILTNPAPTPEALADFYQNHYRRYYRKLDTPDASYIRRYALHRRAGHTADFLQQQNLLGGSVRVLDLGCGEGSILREIRSRHPRAAVVGVEMCDSFRRFAAEYVGSPVHASLDDTADSNFDLIIVSHVLEHVPQPVEFLRELAERLGRNGRLFIDVPDVTAYHWLADLHIAHIFHFSARTLAATAQRAGLVVTHWQKHRPPKLPGCIRAVLARAGQATATQLPEDVQQHERAAADRIRRMGRFAALFSVSFRVVMACYEGFWNLGERLGADKRDATPLPLGSPRQPAVARVPAGR